METKTSDRSIKKIGELSDDGVALYDPETHRFVYLNDNFTKIFGLRHDDLVNDTKILLKLILAEDINYLFSRYKELIEKGHINTTEFRLKFSDGQLKHLSCDVLMLENPWRIIAFVKDVSNAKRHEDYIIKYSAQKDTLLDMLTHNLSGPLMLSRDVIEILKRGYNGNGNADAGKLINIMQENTQQCIDIVNDFLRKEHVESAQTYVRKTRFDVLEKIRVTMDKLIEMNKDKVFILTTSLKTLNINSDAVKFFQVIHNVLSNAIKFTHEGGTIEIEVKESEKTYLICVKDNGIGIPENFKPDIFKEKMVGRTGLKGEKSSGMGLSITKRLVSLMGGKMWFESEENKGSLFFIELPKE
jgi:two-component system, OmpR family, sensor histidine kinase VicK